MELADYQVQAVATAQYKDRAYLYHALREEAGELHGVWARAYREGYNEADVIKECGDILWNLAAICHESGVQIGDIPRDDFPKLRAERQHVAKWVFRLCDIVASDFENERLDLVTVEAVVFYLEYISGMTVNDLAEENIQKLRARQHRGSITGKGDNR